VYETLENSARALASIDEGTTILAVYDAAVATVVFNGRVVYQIDQNGSEASMHCVERYH
jgi:hypothetical protein